MDIEQLFAFLNSNAGVLVAVGIAIGAATAIGGLAWKALSHIYNFRKLKEEHDAVQKEYEVEKKDKDRLEKIIAKYEKVDIYADWLFIPHDPPPRSPLCPICWADGKTIRMKKIVNGSQIEYQCPAHQKTRISVSAYNQRPLMKKLDDLQE